MLTTKAFTARLLIIDPCGPLGQFNKNYPYFIYTKITKNTKKDFVFSYKVGNEKSNPPRLLQNTQGIM